MLHSHSACHKKKVSVTTPSVQSVCGGEAKLLLAACKETHKHVSTTPQIFLKASELYFYIYVELTVGCLFPYFEQF